MGAHSHSQNIFLYCTPSSYWDDKMPTWWHEGRWMENCDVVLGYYLTLQQKVRRRIIHFSWPWITGPWWCQQLNVRVEDVNIWGLWTGRSRIAQDFIKLLRSAHNSKLDYYLFLDFPFNIFSPCLTKNHGKWNDRWERITVMQQIRNLPCFCDI